MAEEEKPSKRTPKSPADSPEQGAEASEGMSDAERERLERAEQARQARIEAFEQERQQRIAVVDQERRKAREQAELDRIARIEAAEEDRVRRGEENRRRNIEAQQAKEEEAKKKAADAIPDPNAIELARSKLLGERHVSRRKTVRSYLLAVVLPVAMLAVYLFGLSTPLYKAEAVFSIQTSSNSNSSVFSGIMGVAGFNSSLRDAFMVREFIVSRSMLARMEAEHGYISHFSDDGAPHQEGFQLSDADYRTYKRRVDVGIDVQEGILKLFVDARTPEAAVQYAEAILNIAEEHVNLLSDQMFAEQLTLMQQNVVLREADLEEARRQLIGLQIEHSVLAPRETVGAINESIRALELKIKDAERIRDVQLQSNVKDSPSLARLQTEISVLRRQVASQRARLVGDGDTESLNNVLAEFENAGIQRDLAQQRWEFALEALEGSRRDAFLQRRYLMVIAPALLPDAPHIMGNLRTLFFSFLILSLLFFAFSVFVAAIRVRTKIT